MKRLWLAVTALVIALVTTVALVPSASAKAAQPGYSDLGATIVTTAPGIVDTLAAAGITVTPVGQTVVEVISGDTTQAAFTFPITKNTADLAAGTGHIRHGGGIKFSSDSAYIEFGKFDIDLKAGKIFLRQLTYSYGQREPIFDLDLSGLTTSTDESGNTVLSGIVLRLDLRGAGALNNTFGTTLPYDNSLVFGTAQVVIAPAS